MTRVYMVLGLVAFILAGFAGYFIASCRCQAQQATQAAMHATQAAIATEEARAKEHALYATMEAIEEAANNEHQVLIDSFDAVSDERDSLHKALLRHRQYAIAHSPSTCECKPVRDASRMYADLLRELSRLAEAYAKEADSIRVRHKACVEAYETLRR